MKNRAYLSVRKFLNPYILNITKPEKNDEKKALFYKKTSFFHADFHLQLTLPYLSPKYPKELKW